MAGRIETAARILPEHDSNLLDLPARYRHLVAAKKAVEGAELPELGPKGSFRPALEEALAGERSMFGDASGRIDLSESLEEVP